MKKEMEAPNLPTRDRTSYERVLESTVDQLFSPVRLAVQDRGHLVGGHRQHRRGQKPPRNQLNGSQGVSSPDRRRELDGDPNSQ